MLLTPSLACFAYCRQEISTKSRKDVLVEGRERACKADRQLRAVWVMHHVHCVLSGPGCMRPSEFAWVYSFSFNIFVSLSLLNWRKDLLHNCLSLKSLAEKVLNFPLDKSPHVRCSNWEAEELTQDQVCSPLQLTVLGGEVTFLVAKEALQQGDLSLFKLYLQTLCVTGPKVNFILTAYISLLFHEDIFMLFCLDSLALFSFSPERSMRQDPLKKYFQNLTFLLFSSVCSSRCNIRETLEILVTFFRALSFPRLLSFCSQAAHACRSSDRQREWQDKKACWILLAGVLKGNFLWRRDWWGRRMSDLNIFSAPCNSWGHCLKVVGCGVVMKVPFNWQNFMWTSKGN